MRRYAPSERAMFRYYVRVYGSILQHAVDDVQIASIVATTKACISDILTAYLKEKIIRPMLTGELDRL